jgi:hypothetical protein
LGDAGVSGIAARKAASWASRLASSSMSVCSEQRALLRRHRLGAGAELPALEARELEVDLLDLGVAPGNIAGLALDQLLLELDSAPA